MNLIVIMGLAFNLVANAGLTIIKPVANLFTESYEPKKISEFSKQNYVPSPQPKTSYKNFNSQASSAIIYDTSSTTKILSKNTEEKRPIASLTKLMTALVIMDSHKPNEVVTVSELPPLGPEDQKMGLTTGEEITVGELLKATLIYSANDAANALAIYDSGSIDNFAKKMNQKADKWGLTSSTFVEPSGLKSGNISTADDLLKLANILSVNKTFKGITSTVSTKVTNQSGKIYNITTTNKILGAGGVVGMKTGFTLDAGQCLITAAERNGKRIITIVLDSPDRFQESKNMIEWAFNNYIWQ